MLINVPKKTFYFDALCGHTGFHGVANSEVPGSIPAGLK